MDNIKNFGFGSRPLTDGEIDLAETSRMAIISDAGLQLLRHGH